MNKSVPISKGVAVDCIKINFNYKKKITLYSILSIYFEYKKNETILIMRAMIQLLEKRLVDTVIEKENIF